MRSYTLLDAIKEEYGNDVALDDGATNWYPQTLVEDNTTAEDIEFFGQQVYADYKGIYAIEDGYIGKKLYTILHGRWSDCGQHFIKDEV